MNILNSDAEDGKSIDKDLDSALARSLFERLRGLIQNKTILVLIDQVIVSGVSFLISIMVARACGEDLFGIYTFGLVFLHYAVGVQSSLVTTPFTIQHARVTGPQRKVHAGSSLFNQWVVASIAALVFLSIFITKYLNNFGPGQAVTAAAEVSAFGLLIFCVPMFLFKEFARRYCFARFEMGTAIIVDAIAFVTIVSILLPLLLLDRLSPAFAYLGMGCGGLLAAGFFLWLRRDRFRIRFESAFSDTFKEWKLGRWILCEQMLTLSCSFALTLLIHHLMDWSSVGQFNGLCMIVNLANPFLYGMAKLSTTEILRSGRVWKPAIDLESVLDLHHFLSLCR